MSVNEPTRVGASSCRSGFTPDTLRAITKPVGDKPRPTPDRVHWQQREESSHGAGTDAGRAVTGATTAERTGEQSEFHGDVMRLSARRGRSAGFWPASQGVADRRPALPAEASGTRSTVAANGASNPASPDAAHTALRCRRSLGEAWASCRSQGRASRLQAKPDETQKSDNGRVGDFRGALTVALLTQALETCQLEMPVKGEGARQTIPAHQRK